MIPQQLKEDVGMFYVAAMSGDPTLKIPGTRSLITLLKLEMQITGNHDNDQLLHWCTAQADVALAMYAKDGDWGQACKLCSEALDRLTLFTYDPDYCTTVEGSFKNVAACPAPGQSFIPMGGE